MDVAGVKDTVQETVFIFKSRKTKQTDKMVVKATQVFIQYVLIFGMELSCAVHSANISDFK